MQKRGKKNIVWLASYPKSGNTWFRMYLTNLLSKHETPKKLSEILSTGIASSRDMFDEITGISSSDLSHDETDALRPAVYRYLSNKSDKILYKKIHDAYILTNKSEPLIPHDTTKSVLYLIRNPMDVAVSFANHLQVPYDKAIDVMENEQYAFCNKTDKIQNQLRQKLLTWSGHVRSWITESKLPLMPIRYEDLFFNPFITFKKASHFIGLTEYSDMEIKRAIQHADFNILKKQEEETGFNEKPPKVESFFRKGVVGDYRQHLTETQIQRIINTHGETMKKFGYLDKFGNLNI